MEQDVVALLKKMNFSEYEAKVYLALLEHPPMNGITVAKKSGVPRAKVYEVLGNMAARGYIVVNQGEKQTYAPITPQELLATKRHLAEELFQATETALARYNVAAENRESIWNISGREAIFHRIQAMAKKAKQRIMIELWEEDAAELKDALEQTAKRGIEIIIMVYGNLDFDFAKVCRHDLSDEVLFENGGRWILFSVDDEEIVAGIVSLEEESRAAWTAHPALVIPITEFIIHDWYIMTVMREFRPIIEEKFGHHLEILRKQFGIKSHKAMAFM